jgi:kinesin family protein 15
VLRCSFLEIYNEVLTDLLNPESTHLQIREDVKHGVYVEHLSEHVITCCEPRARPMSETGPAEDE